MEREPGPVEECRSWLHGAGVPRLGAERSTIQRHDRWGYTHRQALETVPVRGRRLVCCHDFLRGAHATSLKIAVLGQRLIGAADWCPPNQSHCKGTHCQRRGEQL
ncbi:hypothetical protein NDU88_000828 [Pleurodeles waltl]|uniref:Uncharacterized protein n=1 Tax=Pleurodeles waltl TaxID=8319 RepID=A0AAV7THE1_PLEWA|nr:hypothetical protein NDU88_000828 [Pleurodeles waltl]